MHLTGSNFRSFFRVYYGPDSVHSTFDSDTCSTQLGLPTCGKWIPEANAVIMLLANQAPAILGGWCMIGVAAASMSTASGAMLALATVVSNILVGQFVSCIPSLEHHETLLLVARV